MPKIPLSNRTPMIKHVRAEAPLTGGGLHLHNYGSGGTGKAIAAAAEKIGNAASGFGNSMMQYAVELQQTEDNLAAAEDRALFKETSSVLNTQLANNPAVDDETRSQWIAAWQQDYQDQRKNIVARMSKNFRDRHDVDMRSMQQSFASDRLRIINAAKTQRLLDEGEALYRTFCDRGEFDEAEKLVRDNTGKLWNKETAERLLTQDLPMRQEYLNAKYNIDADPDAALTMLQDKNNNPYPFLTIRQRDQLIKYAQAKSAANVVDFVQNYIAQINQGTLEETVETLREKYSQKEISRNQFNAALPYISRYYEERARIQNQQVQQERRMRQLRADDIAGAFIYNTLYAADGSKLTYSAADLAAKRLDLIKCCGGFTSLLDKYMPKLERAAAEKARTPDFWKTPDGEVINNFVTRLRKDVNSYLAEIRFLGMKISRTDLDDSGWAHHFRMELQYRQLAEHLYAKFGNTKEVIEHLIEARKQLNDGTISNFLQWREKNLPLIDIKLGNPISQPNQNLKRTGR